MQSWYVAQSHPLRDTLALHELQAQRFTVFYPHMLNETHSRAEPLFPNYLFVRFDVAAEEWKRINNTRGVRGLLGSKDGEHPTAVPQREMDAVLALVPTARDALALLDRRKRGYQAFAPGALVQVINPALLCNGQVGLVKMQRRQRVSVLLALFGRAVVYTLPATSLAQLRSA